MKLLHTAGPFNALISDLGLPDRNGFDLLREIRFTHPTLPAIALSGYGMDEDVKRAKDAGVVGFITVATEPENWRRSLDLAEGQPTVRVALGELELLADVHVPHEQSARHCGCKQRLAGEGQKHSGEKAAT